MGYTYYGLKDWDKAIECFKKGVDIKLKIFGAANEITREAQRRFTQVKLNCRINRRTEAEIPTPVASTETSMPSDNEI